MSLVLAVYLNTFPTKEKVSSLYRGFKSGATIVSMHVEMNELLSIVSF